MDFKLPSAGGGSMVESHPSMVTNRIAVYYRGMLEIIQEILSSEHKAEEIISHARQNATKQKSDIEADLNTRVAEARDQAKLMLQQKIQHAKNTALHEKREALEKSAESGEQFHTHHKHEIDSLVEEIVSFVITPEYQKDR